MTRLPVLSRVLAALVAVGALGVLLWSRLGGLDQSLWFDEAYTVEVYVEPGPRAVFLAPYLPNNHMLFSLLAWVASLVAGGSEVVYRLWSVVPALLGGLGLSFWLLRRQGVAAALAFLVLWTAAPIVTDLGRQARGYGLVFAGMALLLVAASHAARHGFDRRSYAGVVAGVLVATLTQPVLVLPAAGVFLALLLVRRTRRAAWSLPLVTGLPTLLWYLPVLRDLVESSGQDFGRPLPWSALLTVPVEVFGYTEDAAVLRLGAVWNAVAAVLLVLGAVETWRRSRDELLVLAAPVVVTVGVLLVTRLYVVPRFLSFLFVPCALLAATGVQALAGWSAQRPRGVQPAAALAGACAAALLLWSFVPTSRALVDQPREAYQEVSAFVAGQPGRLVSNTLSEIAFAHYLPRDIEVLPNAEIEALACTATGPLVVIERPVRTGRLAEQCLLERGERVRFPQRAGVGYIDVWLVNRVGPSSQLPEGPS